MRTTLVVPAAAFIASIVLGFALVNRPAEVSAAGYANISMVAGVGGAITTLQCYDPDPFVGHPSNSAAPNPWAPCRSVDDSPPDGVTGPHAGLTAPTDIGNSSGSAVWVQNDYLPSTVRGGYVRIEDASTLCYASGTAGKRSKVAIYYYGNGSTSLYDAHAVYYGHIVQSGAPMNTWLYWNNAFASNPYWPGYVVQYHLNNLTSGGVPVGTVKASPTGCVTGAHLHQETDSGHLEWWDTSKYSEGCRFVWVGPYPPCSGAGYAWVGGQPVTGRYSDVHRLRIYVH